MRARLSLAAYAASPITGLVHDPAIPQSAFAANEIDCCETTPILSDPKYGFVPGNPVGQFNVTGIRDQFGGLFAATKTTQQRRELAQRFVRAYQKGCADYAEAFMKKDAQGNRVFDAVSDAAAKIITKIVYASEPEDRGVALVKASAFPADPQARLDVGDIYKQVEWLKTEKLVDASADPKIMIDLGFVDAHFNLPR